MSNATTHFFTQAKEMKRRATSSVRALGNRRNLALRHLITPEVMVNPASTVAVRPLPPVIVIVACPLCVPAVTVNVTF
jgi:hypothetical protein